MPELPEVETVRRGLADALTGKQIVSVRWRRPDLRFPLPPDFARALEGRRITRVARRAKYLMVNLEGEDADHDDGEDRRTIWLAHLGMSGRFTVLAPGAQPVRPGYFVRDANGSKMQTPIGNGPHDHGLVVFGDGTRLVYTDPRRFGFMDVFPAGDASRNRHLASLGMEPLSGQFSSTSLARTLAGRRLSLKAALLDQRLVAGLGNIYACEALFRARLSPRRRAASLMGRHGHPSPRAGRLADAVRAVLTEAILAGGASLRDYARPDGATGWFQHGFSVYDRTGAPCITPQCAARIKRIVQNNRSTFYCPACQR